MFAAVRLVIKLESVSNKREMAHQPIIIEIADMVFAVEFDCDPVSITVINPLKAFMSAREPEVTIRMASTCPSWIELHEENKTFDSESHWSLYRVDGKSVLITSTDDATQIPDHMVVFDPVLKSVEASGGSFAHLSSDEIILNDLLEYPLSQLLMTCLLAEGRGLMVHACGIDDGGRGYLFAGNSGEGKSTLAMLWKDDAVILNDDRIALCRREGRFWLFGTPWHGDYTSVSQRGVPLEKVFFVGSSNINIASPVKHGTAVPMLLVRSFPPLWDVDGMSFTLDFIERLTREVPFYTLGFVPDHNIVDFVRCAK